MFATFIDLNEGAPLMETLSPLTINIYVFTVKLMEMLVDVVPDFKILGCKAALQP